MFFYKQVSIFSWSGQKVMPNGVSCAYFALKNYKIGKKDSDAFRTGIAGAQTARVVNCAANAVPAINSTSKPVRIVGKIASCAKKIVYPLIIASGAYRTFKADDKVKTGVSQGSAITTMFLSEQAAERVLKIVDKKALNTSAVKNNKYLKIGYSVLKGLSYAAASIFGYEAGNKLGNSAVDKVRQKKETNEAKDEINNYMENEVFDDIENELTLEQDSQYHEQNTADL